MRRWLDCLGVERLMFGGDWAVCVLAGDQAQVWAETNRALGGRSSDEIAAPHYGTATRA